MGAHLDQFWPEGPQCRDHRAGPSAQTGAPLALSAYHPVLPGLKRTEDGLVLRRAPPADHRRCRSGSRRHCALLGNPGELPRRGLP